MNTSAGTLWRDLGYKNKYDCFEWEGEVNKGLKPEFKEAVENLIAKADKGIIVTQLVEAAPKDEVRERKKVDDYKIRLFSVLDAHYNIAVRMFVMPLITVILNYPQHSECFGGMNAGSKEWTELYNYLDAFPHWSDSDYSSFDSSHDFLFLKLFAVFMYRFALRCGYTSQEARITYILICMITVQLYKYQCDYFLKIKGMPSGVIFTLALNSVINSILYRMCFVVLTKISPLEYKKYVRTATVGDDNISSISSDIFEEFNILRMQPLLREWGYIITPGTKDNVISTEIRREDAVFVKRNLCGGTTGILELP